MTKVKKPPTGEPVIKCCDSLFLSLCVRKYNDGRAEWGYACNCGKIYKLKGRLGDE
ncbi:hypothetical protein LCGC14_1232980 [marine sediment metagenome]|uniref:Uncharacterized protein n=1 Tax=marine sediment metagenome TaxID=412755 RepID=A0A0F9NQ73_9ZZZZ